jgi:hypothetical protein
MEDKNQTPADDAGRGRVVRARPRRKANDALTETPLLGAPLTTEMGANDLAVDLATSRSTFEDDVRRRAHEIYLSRGESHGEDLLDWLEAERQIRFERGSAPVTLPPQ